MSRGKDERDGGYQARQAARLKAGSDQISVLPDVNQGRADYAAVYAKSYGDPEPVEKLIAAVLAVFLESDRSFARRRRELS